jgi:hypothetical protein
MAQIERQSTATTQDERRFESREDRQHALLQLIETTA